MNQPPGNYWAQGDPPNTTRYWNGNTWEGQPVPTTTMNPSPLGGSPLTTGHGGYAQKSNAFALVLVASLGFFVCQLASPVAFFLARSELKGMDEGRIDPSERGKAKAAMIIGAVGTLLTIAATIAYIVFIGYLVRSGEFDLTN